MDALYSIFGALHNVMLLLLALIGMGAFAFITDCVMSGRPFTLLEAPGGFWSNLRNELSISIIRLGEAHIFWMRPGVLWGQVGAVGGGDCIDESFKAGGDLSTKQYYFARMSGDNTCVVCDGATDIPLGVVQNKPTSGQTAQVRCFGRSKVNSDEALTVGWLVGPAADGQADRKIPGTDTTHHYGGLVVRATGAAGEIGEIIAGYTPGRGA